MSTLDGVGLRPGFQHVVQGGSTSGPWRRAQRLGQQVVGEARVLGQQRAVQIAAVGGLVDRALGAVLRRCCRGRRALLPSGAAPGPR